MTPRQKKIIVLLAVLVSVMWWQVFALYKDVRAQKESADSWKKIQAERRKNMEENSLRGLAGTSFDPDSEIGQSLKEYREQQREEELKRAAAEKKNQSQPEGGGEVGDNK